MLGFLGGMLGNVGHLYLGLARTVFGFIGGAVRGVITTLGSTLMAGFNGLFSLLEGVAGGLATALRGAVNAATEFSRAALSIRAGTGISYQGAGRLLTRGLAFGMSPEQTAAAYKGVNPLIAMRSQSSDYFSSLSRSFNSFLTQGPLGAMLGRAVLKGQGATDEQLTIAAMNPNKVAAQEKWSNNISSKLGISGGNIQQWAEDFQLGVAKVGTILELLKLKLAAAIGPQLIAGIERFAAFLAKHSERISDILQKIGGTLSTVFLKGFEIVIAYLDENADGISGAINNAFHWLVVDAPVQFLNLASTISASLGEILGSFTIWLREFIANIPDLSQQLHDFFVGLIAHVPTFLGVLDNIINGFRAFVNALSQVMNTIMNFAIDASKVWNAVPWHKNRQVNVPLWNPLPDDIFNGAPQSNMAADQNLINNINSLLIRTHNFGQRALARVQQDGPGFADETGKWADWFSRQSGELGQKAIDYPSDMIKLFSAQKETNKKLDISNKLAEKAIATSKDGFKAVSWTVNILAAAQKAAAQDAAMAARS